MDDEAAIRTLLERALTANGYSVSLAKDGEEALKLYRTGNDAGSRFDFILLDLTIPGGMGGLETYRAIRELDPKVQAFISSGHAEDPVMSNFEDLGLAGVVKKPYSIKDLISLLSQ